jgi:NAD(P)-dependent dehydrogenase (short-subunit alcohol dehydrogenase family)
MSREPELAGQTTVVIGGSSGIGLETARRARSEVAHVVLAGRNPERLEHAARELGALSSAAFVATASSASSSSSTSCRPRPTTLW